MKDPLLTHSLNDYLPMLAQHDSTRAVKNCLTYQSLKKEIEAVLDGIECGNFASDIPYERKSFYRVVAWNLESGRQWEGILDVLKNHPELKQADLLQFTEIDIGMARSGNKNIAREIAAELKMNYFFAPAYLNLGKGNSVEGHVSGENQYGLQGNALLSRYPLENLRALRLKNCKDPMRGQEKRLGSQQALLAEVILPFKKITAVTTHLDAHFSQRQRALQMETIIMSLEGNKYPILIGGDFRASYAFFGFWSKLIRSVDNVLRKNGFEYTAFNELGVQEWFAGKWLRVASSDKGALAPKVYPGLLYQGRQISDHDPILVDIDVYA